MSEESDLGQLKEIIEVFINQARIELRERWEKWIIDLDKNEVHSRDHLSEVLSQRHHRGIEERTSGRNAGRLGRAVSRLPSRDLSIPVR